MTFNQRIRRIIRNILVKTIIIDRLDASCYKSVLITFDDGPHKEITPLILDKLKTYNARCLFFVVGRFAREYPEIIKKLLDDGHMVGNHSFNHPNNPIPKYRSYVKDLHDCQEYLNANFGIRPMFYRPPGGRVTADALVATQFTNLKIMLWSNMGGEWADREGDNAETIGKVITKNLAPRDIIMLHDNNWKVPDILDIILPAIKDEGLDLSRGLDHISKK